MHFEWALDTVHGADYFRRWHREKKNSGGLLVHKSSHHFDLVNWWLGDVPDPRLRPRRAASSTATATPPTAGSASDRRAAPASSATRSRSTSTTTRA